MNEVKGRKVGQRKEHTIGLSDADRSCCSLHAISNNNSVISHSKARSGGSRRTIIIPREYMIAKSTCIWLLILFSIIPIIVYFEYYVPVTEMTTLPVFAP